MDQDEQCPFAIRRRHAESISKAMSRYINDTEGLPLSEKNNTGSDVIEIEESEFLRKDTKASATITRSSPELEFSITPRRLEQTIPPSGNEDHDDSQEQGDPWRYVKTKAGMQHELGSTLKVAQDPLKPRPKPQYHDCYRMSLPGVEDGDISTTSRYEAEESDLFFALSDGHPDNASGTSRRSFDLLDDYNSNGGRSGDEEASRRNSKSRADRFKPVSKALGTSAEITGSYINLGPEPRPSDEAIAKLTMDQKREVCCTRFGDFLKIHSDLLIVIGVENPNDSRVAAHYSI